MRPFTSRLGMGMLTKILQGTTFSGVAFAFATNTEAKEDIIVEWPGAGTQTKQKACIYPPSLSASCDIDSMYTDPNRPLL
jgi:hypothetical protein